MTHIINQTGIVLFINNKSFKVEKSDRRYAKIIEVFSLAKDLQEQAALAIVASNPTSIQSIHGKDGFEVIEDVVWYKGQKLQSIHGKDGFEVI